ncbi:MAG TPA: 50S ribosomal protein L10 [Anaerohalosphaeraceae bacterium]|jgi:large subunit ribosomal protein L10|nr:50S ribosomal protein L10 [Anaerohalosphaeraceae bacterium]
MSYAVKGLVQNDYTKRFKGVSSFVVLQTIGISGVDNNKMRGDLKKKGVKMMVVKNSLMRRALESLGHPKGGQLFDSGPCTVAFGGDSIVDVAKTLETWLKKKNTPLAVKGAYIEGDVLNAAAAKGLSKMPTRAELQAQIVGIAMTPGSNVAGCLVGPGSVIAGCVKTLIEKKEKEAA